MGQNKDKGIIHQLLLLAKQTPVGEFKVISLLLT